MTSRFLKSIIATATSAPLPLPFAKTYRLAAHRALQQNSSKQVAQRSA